jgi:hypothetical protein
LEGAALAGAGRLLAAAVATWVGRAAAVAELGRLLLAGLDAAIARVVGLVPPVPPPSAVAVELLRLVGLAVAVDPPRGWLEPLATDPVLAAVAAVLPLIGAALALARLVLLADGLGLALAVRLGRG